MILQFSLQNQAREDYGNGIGYDQGAVACKKAVNQPEGDATGKKGVHAKGDPTGISAAECSHGLGNEAKRC